MYTHTHTCTMAIICFRKNLNPGKLMIIQKGYLKTCFLNDGMVYQEWKSYLSVIFFPIFSVLPLCCFPGKLLFCFEVGVSSSGFQLLCEFTPGFSSIQNWALFIPLSGCSCNEVAGNAEALEAWGQDAFWVISLDLKRFSREFLR